MGWWSACILGGDTPYDAHGWIWNIALKASNSELDYSSICLSDKIDPFSHDSDFLRKILDESAIQQIVKQISEHAYDVCVYSQVLALMIIESGAPMSEDVREFLLTNSRRDAWAKEDEERAAYVNDLCGRIENYKSGEIQKIPSVGLFESMFNNLS